MNVESVNHKKAYNANKEGHDGKVGNHGENDINSSRMIPYWADWNIEISTGINESISSVKPIWVYELQDDQWNSSDAETDCWKKQDFDLLVRQPDHA